MPYTSIDQLPDPVRNTLPQHAQRIFVEAFNSAYAHLKPGQDEVPAFKIGWAAVKKTYEKVNGRWRRKANNSPSLG
jgi:cation transport regulator